MSELNLNRHPFNRVAHAGQGGLLAAAITIVLGLVMVGATLSTLSQQNAQHSVVTKQSLQTYYAAEAGVQEALASRMLPRSNAVNFNSSADSNNGSLPVSDKKFYTRSGFIYQNPADITKGLVAKYRYIILGGDSARKPDGSYFANGDNTSTGIPRLLSTETIPSTSPFIIVSTGTTCKSTKGNSQALLDRLTPGPIPACSGGTTKDEVTLVVMANLVQEPSGGIKLKDRVIQQRVYKNGTQIPLPAGTFVPGYGWRNAGATVNFDTMWQYTGNGGDAVNPLTLNKVIFYNFADNSIYKNCDVTGSTSTSCGATIANVPANAAIRLYFNGPIDYRSISPTTNLTDRSLTNCQPTPSNPNQADQCNIRVVPDPPMIGSNHAYKSNTTIPLFPGSTQVILLPPMVALTPGKPHQLEVDTTKMRSFSNSAGTKNYRLAFTTK